MSSELEDEQAFVTTAYERLDDLRELASQRLAGVLHGDGPGGTHQARGERDALVTMYTDQIAHYHAVENGLCFGRLDRSDGSGIHLGRIGIRDADPDAEQPLLVDWRAPAAQPFYVATVASPDGVRRRRHLRTAGRTVTGYEDEILAAGAAPSSADTLTNENALVRAMNAARTGRMTDIVETIQAEQDAIIRAPAGGVMVVQGGPGTGKTAVALHRAAYLLYTHRETLARRAVLILGPSATFLRYISRVLPGLGETAVVLRTLGDLYPGVSATGTDTPEAAAVKGAVGMAGILKRAVADRQAVPEETIDVPFDRDVLSLTPQLVADVRDRVRRLRLPHNRAHPRFVSAMVAALARQNAQRVSADILTGGTLFTDADLATVETEIRDDDEVMATIAGLWPPLTPQELVGDLLTDPGRLAAAAPDLGDDERKALWRAVPDAWTPADVALLDEAADLLGTDDRAQREAADRSRAGDESYAAGVLEIISRDIDDDDEILMAHDLIDPSRLADRHDTGDGLSVAERAAADRQWAYGHVIVDEAQELSPMAWRAVMRRCPSRSITVVGDVAQTGDAAGTTSWAAALDPFVADRWRLRSLTVNYRTPAEIMELAAEVLARINPQLRVPRSVRRSGVRPRFVHAADQPLAGLVAELRATDPDRRTAVITATGATAEVRDLLPDAATGTEADLGAPVVLLDVRQAKGLEFDTVIVVDPDRITQASPHGPNDLYVAYTRATQHLCVLLP